MTTAARIALCLGRNGRNAPPASYQALFGGAAGVGTVFKFVLRTRAETVLHSFAVGSDGAYPQSGTAHLAGLPVAQRSRPREAAAGAMEQRLTGAFCRDPVT